MRDLSDADRLVRGRFRGGLRLHRRHPDPICRVGVFGVAIWYVLWVIYFAAIDRHRLVLSPEEKFAMSGGKTQYEQH